MEHFFTSLRKFTCGSGAAIWCVQEELFSVTLTKPDASISFGFGITRDNSVSPSLLKVAQITAGGIADIDGRLSIGNRLLQVLLHLWTLYTHTQTILVVIGKFQCCHLVRVGRMEDAFCIKWRPKNSD